MNPRKHTLWTAAVAVLVVAGVAGVVHFEGPSRQPAAKKPTAGHLPPEVRVAQAKRATLRSTRELAATVEPTRMARLASPAEGPVARLLVREGDVVQRGQLLVVIGRNRTTQARLSSAREELRRVEDEFARVKRLVAQGAVAGELLDKVKAELARAEATVAGGEEVSADFRIQAPWAGVVSQVLVLEGNYVAPRAALLEIFDPASLVVRIALPEAIALKVQRGAEARVRFDALLGEERTGEVTRVFPELDRKLRTRVAEIGVANPQLLAPGMFARVSLTVEVVPDAVVVPAAALLPTLQQEQAVFVVARGVAKRRKVQSGIEDRGRLQIVSGVKAGEMVVVGGQHKLKDGARVRVKEGSPAAGGPAASAARSAKPPEVGRP